MVFRISAKIVSLTHFAIAVFNFYVAYLILQGKRLNKYMAITLVMLGMMALLYHTSIWEIYL